MFINSWNVADPLLFKDALSNSHVCYCKISFYNFWEILLTRYFLAYNYQWDCFLPFTIPLTEVFNCTFYLSCFKQEEKNMFFNWKSFFKNLYLETQKLNFFYDFSETQDVYGFSSTFFGFFVVCLKIKEHKLSFLLLYVVRA